MLVVAVLTVPAAATQILKREPPPGTLAVGDRVLVDDGTCPKGRIKEVAAGANRSLSRGLAHGGSKRTERCVARP
jgi:hypothetical protein